MATSSQRAAKADRPIVTEDHTCPQCGSGEDEHEDNGERPTAALYTLRCVRCDHQWEPNGE